MKNNVIYAADLFCGAGGTSSGLIQACRALGYDIKLLAINHWDVAIMSHKANHPEVMHMCESLDNVDPRKAVPEGRLDILVASPECTHHSIARGGRPASDQSRASAWHILRWAEALYIDNILVENVREFVNWGPIGANGQPMKSKRGATFRAFITALKSLGYKVSWQILNAANYGDPTTRHRFFLLARRGNRRVVWPDTTHCMNGEPTLFNPGLKPWVSAKDIIDWHIKGESIFKRKRPLAEATINRIAAGLKKFGGKSAGPFLVMLYGSNNVRSVDKPLPTVTAGGQHIGLCEPFILPHPHGSNIGEVLKNTPARSVDRPLQSITAKSGNYIGLVEPFITILKGQSKVRGIDKPLPTVTTNSHLCLCEPFLIKYNGQGKAKSINEPLDTITTKDRFGLVETAELDIRFRMLQPHELAAAMSFDHDYEFKGTKADRVRQIGNAVPVRTAKALCEALLN